MSISIRMIMPLWNSPTTCQLLHTLSVYWCLKYLSGSVTYLACYTKRQFQFFLWYTYPWKNRNHCSRFVEWYRVFDVRCFHFLGLNGCKLQFALFLKLSDSRRLWIDGAIEIPKSKKLKKKVQISQNHNTILCHLWICLVSSEFLFEIFT